MRYDDDDDEDDDDAEVEIMLTTMRVLEMSCI